MDFKRFQKNQTSLILAIFAFVLLTIGIISAWNSPSTGYEASIYSATPLIYWISIVIGSLIGTGLIIFSICSNHDNKCNRYIGFILLGLISFIQLALTILRGYFLLNVNGDSGTHLGWINYLEATGTIQTAYPFVHIEPLMIKLVVGCSTVDVMMLLPVLAILFQTLCIYLIAQEVFPHKGEVFLTTIIALLLPLGSVIEFGLYSQYYTSMNLAYTLLYISIYLLIKLFKGQMNKPLFIIVTLIGLSLIFYHPVATILLICVAFFLIITVLLQSLKKDGCHNAVIGNYLLFVCIITGVFYYYHSTKFTGTIIQGLSSIFSLSEDTGMGLDRQVSYLSISGEHGITIDVILRSSGINLILYLILIVAFIVFVRYHFNDYRYNSLWLLLISGIGFIGLATITALGNFEFGFQRFMRPLYILSVLAMGYVLYNIVLAIPRGNEIPCSKKKRTFTLILIFGICILCIISLYPSPYTMNAGYQTTAQEWNAMESLLPSLNFDNNIIVIQFSGITRYIGAIYEIAAVIETYSYGGESLSISTDLTELSGFITSTAPHHFSYDVSPTLSSSYDKISYLFITQEDRQYYPAYFPALGWWSNIDYQHLYMDISVSKIYSNNGFDGYYIIP